VSLEESRAASPASRAHPSRSYQEGTRHRARQWRGDQIRCRPRGAGFLSDGESRRMEVTISPAMAPVKKYEHRSMNTYPASVLSAGAASSHSVGFGLVLMVRQYAIVANSANPETAHSQSLGSSSGPHPCDRHVKPAEYSMRSNAQTAARGHTRRVRRGFLLNTV